MKTTKSKSWLIFFSTTIILLLTALIIFHYFSRDKQEGHAGIALSEQEFFETISKMDDIFKGIRILNDGDFPAARKKLEEEIENEKHPEFKALLLIRLANAVRRERKFLKGTFGKHKEADAGVENLYLAREIINNKTGGNVRAYLKRELGQEFLEIGHKEVVSLANEEFSQADEIYRKNDYNGYYALMNKAYLAQSFMECGDRAKTLAVSKEIIGTLDKKGSGIQPQEEVYLRQIICSTYYSMGEYDLAVPALEKLAAIAPPDSFAQVTALIFLAWSHLEMKDEKKGLAYLEKSLSGIKRKLENKNPAQDGGRVISVNIDENYNLLGMMLHSVNTENKKVKDLKLKNDRLIEEIEMQLSGGDFKTAVKNMEKVLKDLKAAN